MASTKEGTDRKGKRGEKLKCGVKMAWGEEFHLSSDCGEKSPYHKRGRTQGAHKRGGGNGKGIQKGENGKKKLTAAEKAGHSSSGEVLDSKEKQSAVGGGKRRHSQ